MTLEDWISAAIAMLSLSPSATQTHLNTMWPNSTIFRPFWRYARRTQAAAHKSGQFLQQIFYIAEWFHFQNDCVIADYYTNTAGYTILQFLATRQSLNYKNLQHSICCSIRCVSLEHFRIAKRSWFCAAEEWAHKRALERGGRVVKKNLYRPVTLA